MYNRLVHLKGTTALLYFGPLLAGLAGFGWSVIPVFVAIFVLWLMILRPHQWPHALSDWAGADVWAAALARLLTQVLLVAVCFGIGRGIGGILGFLPILHPMLPIGLSFLSIPLSRMIWDPWKAAESDVSLDDALRSLSEPGPLRPDLADQAIADLLAQPGDADDRAIAAELGTVLDHPQAWARLDTLLVALDQAGPNRDALRRALILWGTDPDRVALGRPHGIVESAFATAGRDPALLRLFLPRAVSLISAFPERVDSFPERFDLDHAMALPLPDDVIAGLGTLSAAILRATPPELRERSGLTGGVGAMRSARAA